MSVREAEEKLQERAGKLVEREVFCHVGGLIQELDEYTSGQWSLDNFYQDYEPTDEQVKEYMENNDIGEEYAYDALRDEFEPMEYWAVSEWLMRKLRAENEVVAEVGLTNIWARQTSGQAIAIDYVIEKIVESTNYAKGL